jgi:hypothetical protein
VANLVVSAVSTFDNKGLKKGQKEISAFEKNLKSLSKTFGTVFGTAALISYGKKSVDAFIKDEAAAKALEQQLKNTGYAFASPDVEYYIANLQKMYGVLDDQLRPAFQTMLTASGSLTKSQRGLALALDISAATGKSVEEVSAALAKGFTGQTTALSRLGAGIDKATLATGDMNKIMDEAEKKFSGQALARLGTYAGKMDQLKIASENVKESIGKGILDALSALGKDTSIKDATTKMEAFGTVIANVITGLGAIIGKFSELASNTGFNKLLSFLYNTSGIALLAKLGASTSAKANAPSSNFTYSLGANANAELTKLQELKARKALIVTLKAEADLKKLKDKYDIERIGLMAALNSATDEETKLRLAEKLAILDGNAAMAAKYLAERDAEQGLEELAAAADSATAAFDRLKVWDPLSGLKATKADISGLSDLTALVGVLGGLSTALGGKALGGTAGKTAIDTQNSIINGQVNPNFPGLPPATTNYDPLSSLMATTADIAATGAFNPLSGLRPTQADINVYIDASNMIDSANMTKVVQQAFLEINKNGYSTVPAGQGF